MNRAGSVACRRPGLQLARALMTVLVMALAVSVGVVTDGAGAPVGAQAGPPVAVPGNGLRLTEQSSWVRNGQSFRVGLAVTTPDPAAARLQVTVFGPLLNRTDFTSTLSDRIHTARLRVFEPVTLNSLGRSPSISITVNPRAASRAASSLSLSSAGVYPVRIDLVDQQANLLDRLDTHLVYLGDQANTVTRLDVALIAPVHAPPTAGSQVVPAAGPTEPVEAQPPPTGLPEHGAQPLAALIAALAANPQVPVTVAPTPETIEELAAGSNAQRVLVTQLTQVLAAAGRQVVAAPFVRIDLPGLSSAGLESDITAQLAQGSAVLGSDLHVAPAAPGTWVEGGPLSTGAVDDLAGRGVRRLVVPDDSLTPLPVDQRKTTLAAPFAMAVKGGRQIQAVAADPALAGHFNSGPDQVLAAHQLLADLAVIQEELPQARGGRGVAIIPPDDWRPDAGFMTAVLDGIATSPTLSAVTLDRLFTDVTPLKSRQSTLVRGVEGGQPRPRTLVDAAAIKAASRPLTSLASTLPAGAPVLDEIKRNLLVSESRDINPATRGTMLAAVSRLVDQVRSMVRLPGNRSITFTAHEGVIPVTILSSAPFPTRISIRVTSQKLGFRQTAVPAGSCARNGTAEVCTLELRNQNTTVKIPVTAKTAGVFSLTVALQSPDGGVVFATDVDTVRSTAASGVGVILSVGAVVLLGVWWARDLRHGRRARQLVPSGDTDGSDESGAGALDAGFDPGPVAARPRWRPPAGAWAGPELADDWRLPEFGLDESCFAIGFDGVDDGAPAEGRVPLATAVGRHSAGDSLPVADPPSLGPAGTAPPVRDPASAGGGALVASPVGRAVSADGGPMVSRAAPAVGGPGCRPAPAGGGPVDSRAAAGSLGIASPLVPAGSRPAPASIPHPDRAPFAFDDPTGPLPMVPVDGSGRPGRPETGASSGDGAFGDAALGGSFSRRTAVMASGTVLSRITGFGRVLALVWAFRLTGLADVYNIANTVPNIAYDLVLGGVLSATLVPVFVDYLGRDDPDECRRAVGAVVTAVAVVLVALSGVFWLLAPAIIRFYLVLNHTAGAADQGAIGTTLLRLFVPQLFLLGGIAVTTALLNARRHFAVPAFSPVINNLVAIAAIVATRVVASSLTLSQFRHEQVALLLLGLGTTSGYLLQFAAQLPPLIRGGFRFRPVWDLSHPAVRTVLRLSLWTFGSVLANQVAFNLVLVLADKRPGDVTVFQTAYQFFQLPYAIFAVSIASVITPDLSERWSRHDVPGFRRQISQGVRLTLAVVVPAAVGYVVLAGPFLQLVFHHGSFSAAEAQRIAVVVALFAVGLPGFSAYLLLMRGYQAMQDTRSMFWLYLVENLATLVLAGALYPYFGVRGLALGWVGAYSIGSIVAFVHLRTRTDGLEGRATLRTLVRVSLATATMAITVIAAAHVIGGGSDIARAGQVGAGALVGTVAYLAVSHALGITEVTGMLRRHR